MKREYIVPFVILLLIAGGSLIMYLHNADLPVLQPAGPVALGERSVIIITLALCAIVVVPVFVMLFLFAWMFRADNPKTRHWHVPDWDHHTRVLELVWWLVPTVIIAFLSIVAWQSSHALDPYKPLSSAEPMVIQVVALDWKWLFIYPQQGIASVNMVEFPQNVPVRFELTADAPMNSFWIPSLGGQIMVMPGMTTQLNLMASRTGTFNGLSANISGEGFAGMAFTARSVSADGFTDWVESVRQSTTTPLSLSTYNALAVPSEYNPVTYYSSVDGNLYSSITMKFMTPSQTMTGTMMNGMPMHGPSTP